jgi:hypothetical protein
MRTNMILNDELVREARRFSQARTKTGLVEEALRTFVQVKENELRRMTYSQRLSELDRKLAGLVLREGPESVLRADRERQ